MPSWIMIMEPGDDCHVYQYCTTIIMEATVAARKQSDREIRAVRTATLHAHCGASQLVPLPLWSSIVTLLAPCYECQSSL